MHQGDETESAPDDRTSKHADVHGRMASAALKRAQTVVSDGHVADSTEFIAAARELARQLKFPRAESSTFRAIFAVLKRGAHSSDKAAWEAYGAKQRTYQQWKALIEPLEPQAVADGFLNDDAVVSGFAMMAIACESFDEGTLVWAVRDHDVGQMAIPTHTQGVVMGRPLWAAQGDFQVKWNVDAGNWHPGHTCDICRKSIQGVRYHQKGTNFDLCSADFQSLPSSEQRNFAAVEPSVVNVYRDDLLGDSLVTAGTLHYVPGAFKIGQTVWASNDMLSRESVIVVPKNLSGTITDRVYRQSGHGRVMDYDRVSVKWQPCAGHREAVTVNVPVSKLVAKSPTDVLRLGSELDSCEVDATYAQLTLPVCASIL